MGYTGVHEWISNHEDGPDGETFDPLIDPVAERIKATHRVRPDQ